MFVENLRISQKSVLNKRAQEHAAQRVVKCSVFFFIVLPLPCCSRWFRDLKQGGGPDRPPPRPSHMVNFVSEQTQKKAAAATTHGSSVLTVRDATAIHSRFGHICTLSPIHGLVLCVSVCICVCVSVCVSVREITNTDGVGWHGSRSVGAPRSIKRNKAGEGWGSISAKPTKIKDQVWIQDPLQVLGPIFVEQGVSGGGEGVRDNNQTHHGI